MNKLEALAKKYNFQYEEKYEVDWSKKLDDNNNDIFIPLDEALLAKDTNDEYVVWIYRIGNHIGVSGNTDVLNIHISDTRKDLTAEKLVVFSNELNAWAGEYGWSIPLHVIVDPEDWQEIANIPDAYQDIRYLKIAF